MEDFRSGVLRNQQLPASCLLLLHQAWEQPAAGMAPLLCVRMCDTQLLVTLTLTMCLSADTMRLTSSTLPPPPMPTCRAAAAAEITQKSSVLHSSI